MIYTNTPDYMLIDVNNSKNISSKKRHVDKWIFINNLYTCYSHGRLKLTMDVI